MKARVINASQFLLFVHFRHMCAQSIFALKCFLTLVTIVTKMTREVDTLNMVPCIICIIEMRVFFSTDAAFEAKSPILELEPLHVLVKDLSISKAKLS